MRDVISALVKWPGLMIEISLLSGAKDVTYTLGAGTAAPDCSAPVRISCSGPVILIIATVTCSERWQLGGSPQLLNSVIYSPFV